MSAWKSFDDVRVAAPAGPHPLPAIPCGLYEADEPGGSTVPVRVRRRHAGPHEDRWTVEWLLGSDDRTWEAFAYVGADGLDVWPPFRKTDYALVADRLFRHVRHGECFDGWAFRLARPACARCGRELKKESDRAGGLHGGCRQKWGLADAG